MNISKYCFNEINNNKFIYELYTVINHIGVINYGHYYTYIKKQNNNININLIEFNDILIKDLVSDISNLNDYFILY